MARSVFRFLSRQSDTVELAGDRHLLRLPRFQDYRQWYALRSESRRFLEPWEPTWRNDELTESAFRTRVIRNEQEFSSGQAVPLLVFTRAEATLLGGLTSFSLAKYNTLAGGTSLISGTGGTVVAAEILPDVAPVGIPGGLPLTASAVALLLVLRHRRATGPARA